MGNRRNCGLFRKGSPRRRSFLLHGLDQTFGNERLAMSGYAENSSRRCAPDLFVLVYRRLPSWFLQCRSEPSSLVQQRMGMLSLSHLFVCFTIEVLQFFERQVRKIGPPSSWCSLSTADFTASDAEWEAKETIDAGACTRGFYLSTGGDVCSSVDVGCRIDCSHIRRRPPILPLP